MRKKLATYQLKLTSNLEPSETTVIVSTENLSSSGLGLLSNSFLQSHCDLNYAFLMLPLSRSGFALQSSQPPSFHHFYDDVIFLFLMTFFFHCENFCTVVFVPPLSGQLIAKCILQNVSFNLLPPAPHHLSRFSSCLYQPLFYHQKLAWLLSVCEELLLRLQKDSIRKNYLRNASTKPYCELFKLRKE